MRFRTVQFGALLALSWVAVVSFASGVPALTGPKTIAPLIEAVTPSVVNISATKPVAEQEGLWGWRNQQRTRVAIGSGVIIDADNGYIVTNEHVIRDAVGIRISLDDGRSFNATIVGEDRYSDVALLEIQGDDLKALTLADSDETRVGDFVVAIGNPFRLQHTVTSGIVSALGRKNLDIEAIEDFIQTDASINQGNSGGPLINFHGEVIGINTAIIGDSNGSVGIGFAIPSNLVKETISQIIEFGSVSRGYLGVQMERFTESDAENYARIYDLDSFRGVKISMVTEGSAADEAGIEGEDVIVSFDGKGVSGWEELIDLIRRAKLGDNVPIELLREGKKLTVHAEIRPLYSEETFPFEGATLFADTAIVPRLPSDSNPYRYTRTTVLNVTDVEPDSEADKLGIEVYDQIIGSEEYVDNAGDKIIAVDLLRDESERMTLTLRKGAEPDSDSN